MDDSLFLSHAGHRILQCITLGALGPHLLPELSAIIWAYGPPLLAEEFATMFKHAGRIMPSMAMPGYTWTYWICIEQRNRVDDLISVNVQVANSAKLIQVLLRDLWDFVCGDEPDTWLPIVCDYPKGGPTRAALLGSVRDEMRKKFVEWLGR